MHFKPVLPWADPSKCAPCKGLGLIVTEVQCDAYACGFTTQASTCPACLGSGRAMPVALDRKAAAAGEAAQ